MTSPEPTNQDETRRDRLTFYPVVLMATIFCITIFLVIAATFGDPAHPVNKWINKNANTLFIVEAILLVVLSIVAMAIDRVRTLKRMAEQYEALSERPESTPIDTRTDGDVD